MLPVRGLPVVQNWDCQATGSCCKEYRIPVTAEEVERITAQGWTREDLDGQEPFTTTGWFTTETWLNSRDGEGCVFLSKEGRCRIHERHGYEAKPLPCRLFPFVLVPAGDHRRVGVRYACPSAAANKGRGSADHAGDLHMFAGQLATREGLTRRPDGSITAPPAMDDGTVLEWPDTLRIVDALVKILRQEGSPVERRIRKCLHFANLMKQAKLAEISGTRLGELLGVLSAGAEAEVPRDPAQVPAPGWMGRWLFSQSAALFTRKDQGPQRGEDIKTWMGRLGAAWSFFRWTGQVPRLHARIPVTTFEEAELPRGPLPPEAERVLERYFVIKTWSLQFCASSKGPPFWEGFETLCLLCPLILWVARLFRDIPREQAIITALTIVDDHFGFNPLLHGYMQRMGVRMMSWWDQIAALTAWYSR